MEPEEHNEVSKETNEVDLPSSSDVKASTSVAGNPVLEKEHKDDKLSGDDDPDKTITMPRSARSHASNRVLQPPIVATEDAIDPLSNRVLQPSTTAVEDIINPLPVSIVYKPFDARHRHHKRKGSSRNETGQQYRSAIKHKRRHLKLGKIVFPLIIVLIFVLGTVGVLYYAGINIVNSFVGIPATASPISNIVKPSVSTASPVKTLEVQGDAIAVSQGYTNSAQQTAYIDIQMHIQLLSSVDGQTWQQSDLTHLTGAPVANGNVLASYSWEKGAKQQIAYIDISGHIHLLSSGADGHWQAIDVTQLAAAPLSNGQTLFGYEWAQTGSQQIDFVDSAQHIQELESVDGTSWRVIDVTNVTHTVPSNGTALTAFIWTRANEEHLVYVDEHRHIVDLRATPDGNWQSTDLTTTYGAPLSNGNALVGYEWRINGTAYIDYIDSDNHIQELSSSLQSPWVLSDLMEVTGRPVTNGKALAGYDWIQGGSRIILYIDANKHIQELSQLPQENWNGVDLTQITTSPLVDSAGLLGYTWSVHGSQQVVFVDETHHVEELSDVPNGNWRKVTW